MIENIPLLDGNPFVTMFRVRKIVRMAVTFPTGWNESAGIGIIENDIFYRFFFSSSVESLPFRKGQSMKRAWSRAEIEDVRSLIEIWDR